jgi:hypothetical protein
MNPWIGANIMAKFYPEPTLSEVLIDPLTQTVMAADRVDVQALAAMLAGVAKRLNHPPRQGADRFIPMS